MFIFTPSFPAAEVRLICVPLSFPTVSTLSSNCTLTIYSYSKARTRTCLKLKAAHKCPAREGENYMACISQWQHWSASTNLLDWCYSSINTLITMSGFSPKLPNILQPRFTPSLHLSACNHNPARKSWQCSDALQLLTSVYHLPFGAGWSTAYTTDLPCSEVPIAWHPTLILQKGGRKAQEWSWNLLLSFHLYLPNNIWKAGMRKDKLYLVSMHAAEDFPVPWAQMALSGGLTIWQTRGLRLRNRTAFSCHHLMHFIFFFSLWTPTKTTDVYWEQLKVCIKQ